MSKNAVRVKPKETVTVEWLDSPYHDKGATSKVHPEAAKKLEKSKRAKIVSK